jgi:hypothetical protein
VKRSEDLAEEMMEQCEGMSHDTRFLRCRLALYLILRFQIVRSALNRLQPLFGVFIGMLLVVGTATSRPAVSQTAANANGADKSRKLFSSGSASSTRAQ